MWTDCRLLSGSEFRGAGTRLNSDSGWEGSMLWLSLDVGVCILLGWTGSCLAQRDRMVYVENSVGTRTQDCILSGK